MKLLQGYITRHLLWATLATLAVLVAIFAFFSLIDQLGETNKGNYGVLNAIVYVLLTLPRLAYELFPIAAMIGAMASLGTLAQHNELDVIRISGVSRAALCGLLVRSALVIVLIGLIIGELLAPYSEQKAQHQRSMAMTEKITLQTKYGFWARDGMSFINIRQVLPNDEVREIYIYEFDDKSRLRNSIYSPRAQYIEDNWMLYDIRQTVIAEDEVKSKTYKKALWGSLLDPEIVNLVIIRPQYLTLWGLYNYIQYLRLNSQNAIHYEQALYAKLMRPITIVAMIILAIPLVQGNARFTAIGQRVFIGAVIGMAFHFINLASSNLGIVYNLPPLLMVCWPTLLLLLILYHLLRED